VLVQSGTTDFRGKTATPIAPASQFMAGREADTIINGTNE